MEVFFNGTGLVLPFNVVSDFNEFKNEQVEMAKKVNYHKRFKVLFNLQKKYNEYIFEDKKYNMRRYLKTKLFDKIFCDVTNHKGMGVAEIAIWTGCVFALIEEGKLKENDMNGFRALTYHSVTKEFIRCHSLADIDRLLLHEGNENILFDFVKIKKEQITACMVCNKQSTHHCRDCYAYYCSPECQKTDLFQHKRQCVEIRKAYVPRTGKNSISLIEF